MGLRRLLIRADASPEIGTGHVMRCLALAQAWQDAGGKAVFVLAKSTPAIAQRLNAENCGCVTISAEPGSSEDAELTKAYANLLGADWVVIDGYKFTANYQKWIIGGKWKLLCIDDEGNCEHYSADLVLNQNVTTDQRLYRKHEQHTNLLLGPRFCLLRREFTKWREWQRHIPQTARRLLVTLGGSTPTEVGLRLLESLKHVNFDGFHTTFVVGGSTRDVDSLEGGAAHFSSRITFLKDVPAMPVLMSEADAAISAAGSTCWELCFFGLPSILVDIAPNQVPVATRLHQLRCALYHGSGNCIELQLLARSISNFLHSFEIRNSLSRRSRELVDGLGAERVVSAMRGLESFSEIEHAGTALS